jgi:hypothetical protein
VTGLDWVLVGDVLSLQRRVVQVDLSARYEEIGIRSFGRGVFHKEPCSGLGLGSKRVFRIEPGDLVISNVFAWEGAIAVASDAEAGKIGSHRFMTFVPKNGRIDTSWAAWFFRSEPGLELIRQASPGSAGRNRTLSIERFERLEIPLPSIDAQRRVADELDTVDRGVRSVVLLEQRSGVLAAATRSALAAGNAEELSSWRRVALHEVLSLRCDETRVAPETTYQMAGVYSFGRGLFARADLDGAKTSYKVLHRLREGQLVMSRLFAWEGALALVPPRFGGYFVSPEFPTFDIDPDLADPSFLAALLTSEPFWSQLRGASQGIGVRRQRVHADRLLQQEIELPPLVEQRARAATIEIVATVQQASTERSVRVAALVPAALNQAFSLLS